MSKYENTPPMPWRISSYVLELDEKGHVFLWYDHDMNPECEDGKIWAKKMAVKKLMEDAPKLAEQNAKMLVMLKRICDYKYHILGMGSFGEHSDLWYKIEALIAEMEG